MTVTPAPLTLTAAAASKPYGTALNFLGTEFTSVGLVGGDKIGSLTLGSSGSVIGANAGSYPIIASNAVFTAGSASNYSISYANGTLTVTPATLTLSPVSDFKIYDGTTISTGTVGVAGLIGTDTISSLSQSFDSANVLGQNGSTLSVTPGYVLNDGNGGANYKVFSNFATGTIDPYPVSLTGSRRYDSTRVVDASVFTIGPLVGVETLNLTGSGLVADPNVSTGQSVILDTLALANGSGLASNYTFSGGTQTVDIMPVPIGLLSIKATDASKPYGVGYTFSGNEFAASGLIGNDTIVSATLSSAGAASNADAGSYPIVVSNPLFGVGNAVNYDISYLDGTMTVTPKQLFITGSSAANKIYDGSRNASVMLGSTIAGLVGNETLGVSASGQFDTKHAGTAKPVAVTYALTDGSGRAQNYTLNGEVLSADVISQDITFTAPGISKTYDGTNGYVTSVADLFAFDIMLAPGDMVSSIDMNFADPNAGVGKTVNLNAVTINDGNAGNNYNVKLTASNSGIINQANLLVKALPGSKELGSPEPSLTYSVVGLHDPVDSVLNGTLSRTPADDAIGIYQINQGSLGLTSPNYVLTFVPSTFTIKAPAAVQSTTQESVDNGTQQGETEDEKKKREQAQIAANEKNDQGSGLPENLPVCR